MRKPTRVVRLPLATLVLLAGFAVASCSKKPEAAVEAVETGAKKPPVVSRKSKSAPAVAAAESPTATAAGVRGRPPAAVAAAVAAPVAVTPTAAPVPALRPQPGAAPPAAVAPAPGAGAVAAAQPAAALAAPAPAAVPPAAAPAAAEAEPAPAAIPAPAGRALGVPRPLDRPQPTSAEAEPGLDVNGYISTADLEFVLGPKQKFRRTDLLGSQPAKNYNALYYAPQTGDQFGVSVQVWQDATVADSRVRFNSMRNSWSNVAPTNRITEGGFRAHFEGVVTMVFADPRRPLIAAVSCSTKICTGDQLAQLSQRVFERLH